MALIFIELIELLKTIGKALLNGLLEFVKGSKFK